MANSIDLDQTAPFRSSLIWVYTVCSVLYARIFQVDTLHVTNIQTHVIKLQSTMNTIIRHKKFSSIYSKKNLTQALSGNVYPKHSDK